ncbi:hypothetical protein [Allosphingosinicella indica]|uniref:Uncharacterized protein n=1 Tax=Allosphingosinicella indica TaxID=941907 RepID=A0A1X7H1G6_9SPHN|nr:hypothetical protein [Allosphingosinicella indica]SMF77284.1 hypothetical protein SAMN06295910_2566 [Allosphingosinicella indica]
MGISKAAISAVGFTAMLGLAAPAHAYLDPATGSIILQALFGAIAGATLFFRTSLYRLKAIFQPRRKADTEQDV